MKWHPITITFVLADLSLLLGLHVHQRPAEIFNTVGGLLELAGLAVVVLGLSSRRKFASGRTLLSEVWGRLKKLVPRKGKKQAIGRASIDASTGRFEVTGHAADLLVTKTLEDRVDALEKRARQLKQLILQVRTQSAEGLKDQRRELRETAKQLREADAALRSEIKQQFGEGLRIEFIGVVWVALGIALTTWAHGLEALFFRLL